MPEITDRRGIRITGLRWLGSRKKFRGKTEPVELMSYAEACKQVAHAEQLLAQAAPSSLLKLRDAARAQCRRIQNAEDIAFFEHVMEGPGKKRTALNKRAITAHTDLKGNRA